MPLPFWTKDGRGLKESKDACVVQYVPLLRTGNPEIPWYCSLSKKGENATKHQGIFGEALSLISLTTSHLLGTIKLSS